MAEKKSNDDPTQPDGASAPPENYQGQVANQDTSIRDASHPDEKPDPSTVAQVEEIKE